MSKVKEIEPGKWQIHCPACKMRHTLDERWDFNGNKDRPTFSPSLRVEGGRYEGEEYIQLHCHSYITNGEIRYLRDSNHTMAGQTVGLPEVEQ